MIGSVGSAHAVSSWNSSTLRASAQYAHTSWKIGRWSMIAVKVILVLGAAALAGTVYLFFCGFFFAREQRRNIKRRLDQDG
jgi:uncharacterized paraquat-inducible protein A